MSMLNHFFNYKPEVLALDEKAMELCQPYFRHMEEIRDFNQLKMLKAFAGQGHRRAAHCADGERACRQGGAPGASLQPGAGALLYPAWL